MITEQTLEKIFSDRTDTLNTTNYHFRENKPAFIVIHATHSYDDFDKVLQKHRTNNWAGIGYHLFVSHDGTAAQGRPFEIEGAHTLGFNTKSVGIGFYKNGHLSEAQISKGKELIAFLKDKYGQLEVIPHIVAQVRYVNQLLKDEKIDKKFRDDVDIVNPSVFDELKKEFDAFAGNISTEQHTNLKERIKALKNCPGPMFLNFR